jgi:antitoxin VapB
MKAANSTRQVRLFKNGRSQALRIPREFELPGDTATLHRDKAGRLVIEPIKKPSLTALLDKWEPLSDADSMPTIEDMPAEPVDF